VVLRCVDRYSDLFGSKIKSDGRSWAGVTEEMYATSTSETGPRLPVRSKTGRSFMPGTSPNGRELTIRGFPEVVGMKKA
jgi:hypothetical protein